MSLHCRDSFELLVTRGTRDDDRFTQTFVLMHLPDVGIELSHGEETLWTDVTLVHWRGLVEGENVSLSGRIVNERFLAVWTFVRFFTRVATHMPEK